jgi:hypothetical protein
MPYVPEWEPLAAAVTRIMAFGVEEDQAKSDLCLAIADDNISIRVTISKPNKPDRIYFRENVGVPKHLLPSNINWTQSRPIAAWWIGPALGQHYNWDGGEEWVDCVEAATADVIELLCSNEPLIQTGLGSNTHKRNAVDKAIEELGIRKLDGMLQKERELTIQKYVTDRFKQKVSDRFIRTRFKEKKTRPFLNVPNVPFDNNGSERIDRGYLNRRWSRGLKSA